ncbi:MAG: aryldialkylphosphatase [Spirochaetales bacterium]|nr:aryldialkylphosphatase [Spirochaetales bacterium]
MRTAVGCESLVDCTGAYFGRAPLLLRELSDRTGLHILTNTGYYGAAGGKVLPRHAQTDTIDELAERWIAEWRDGIGGTGIKPGFIKIAVDPGPLDAVEEKLIRASARTHLDTGLTIAAHTGAEEAAYEEISLLQDEGVALSAWIWVHANAVEDCERLLCPAREGAWIEFDGLRDEEQSIKLHCDLVLYMKEKNLLSKVLLSHDGDAYQADRPGGGISRPYSVLQEKLIPRLRSKGLLEQEIMSLTVVNPKKAFSIGVRRA